MKTNGNDKALESYKIFPVIAWIVTISFFLFVYNLTLKLQTVADRLETRTNQLEKYLDTQPEDIVDFEL